MAAEFIAVFFGIVFFFILAFYAYVSICLYRIAQRTKTEDPVLAWIPVANLYLLTKIGQKPGWWMILLLIPIVNIVFSIILWSRIAVRMGKPDWWGIILGLVPILNFVFMGLLAFGEYKLKK